MAHDLFDASASALGYAYQWRLGLLLLLRAMREDLQTTLSIERIDDLSLAADTASLFQTKHHKPGAGSLTDGSDDLWKTIRVWCARIRDKTVDPATSRFAIVTTSPAPDESTAALLRQDDQRDPTVAEQRLLAVARSSKSVTNKSAYEAFEQLDPAERTALVNNVFVFDGEERVANLPALIEREILVAADPQHLGGFRERLEGWWFNRVITHLDDIEHVPISAEELNIRIGDLREQYHRDSLPIDFLFAEPNDLDVDNDTRMFVHQLRLITINNSRIESAIRDYYRAFEQRSRWIREDLLHIGELDAYERRLVEEWKRYGAILEDDLPVATDAEKVEFGRRFYRWVELDAKLPIRPRCEEDYVMRGSYHILADGHRVGWHPEFIERLKHLMAVAS